MPDLQDQENRMEGVCVYRSGAHIPCTRVVVDHSSGEEVLSANRTSCSKWTRFLPTDYPFELVEEKRGSGVFEIDHIIPSDFEMVIYGPCSNPKVLINGYPYRDADCIGEK